MCTFGRVCKVSFCWAPSMPWVKISEKYLVGMNSGFRLLMGANTGAYPSPPQLIHPPGDATSRILKLVQDIHASPYRLTNRPNDRRTVQPTDHLTPKHPATQQAPSMNKKTPKYYTSTQLLNSSPINQQVPNY